MTLFGGRFNRVLRCQEQLQILNEVLGPVYRCLGLVGQIYGNTTKRVSAMLCTQRSGRIEEEIARALLRIEYEAHR